MDACGKRSETINRRWSHNPCVLFVNTESVFFCSAQSSSITAVWNKRINSATDSQMTASEPSVTGNGERLLLPRHFQVGELVNFSPRLWGYWIN